MRRLEDQRFTVVVPAHVNHLLADLPQTTAEALKVRLYEAARQVEGLSGAPTARFIDHNGVRLYFEQDPENRVLIALDVVAEGWPP
jgi:hypothetical protein